MSNVSQLCRAAYSYARDENATFPSPGMLGTTPVFYTLSTETANVFGMYNDNYNARSTVYHCPSNDTPPRGGQNNSLFRIDHYNILTHVEDFNLTYLGKSSYDGSGLGEVLFTENLSWWVSLDSTWGSNHGTGQILTSWNSLKKMPYGFNQGNADGSVKWQRVSSLSQHSDAKIKRGDLWVYYVEK